MTIEVALAILFFIAYVWQRSRASAAELKLVAAKDQLQQVLFGLHGAYLIEDRVSRRDWLAVTDKAVRAHLVSLGESPAYPPLGTIKESDDE